MSVQEFIHGELKPDTSTPARRTDEENGAGRSEKWLLTRVRWAQRENAIRIVVRENKLSWGCFHATDESFWELDVIQ